VCLRDARRWRDLGWVDERARRRDAKGIGDGLEGAIWGVRKGGFRGGKVGGRGHRRQEKVAEFVSAFIEQHKKKASWRRRSLTLRSCAA